MEADCKEPTGGLEPLICCSYELACVCSSPSWCVRESRLFRRFWVIQGCNFVHCVPVRISPVVVNPALAHQRRGGPDMGSYATLCAPLASRERKPSSASRANGASPSCRSRRSSCFTGPLICWQPLLLRGLWKNTWHSSGFLCPLLPVLGATSSKLVCAFSNVRKPR